MEYLCYTIQPGDTLERVAAAFQMTVESLVMANPHLITQPVVTPGVVLAIPQPSAQQQPGVTPQPAWPATPSIPAQPAWPSIPAQPAWPAQPAMPEQPMWPLQPICPTTPTEQVPNPNPAPQPDAGANQPALMEAQVIELVNNERLRRGLQPLMANASLSNVARIKSEDMAAGNYFDHVSPTYGTPYEMLRKFGVSYRSAGENIAKGQTTPQSVMNSWMNSSGHAANILSADFSDIGVGYSYNNGSPVWTQIFTRP